MTSIFWGNFFPVVFRFFTGFVFDFFVFCADVSVANLSVPFDTPVGMHFIFCNKPFELHLK